MDEYRVLTGEPRLIVLNRTLTRIASNTVSQNNVVTIVQQDVVSSSVAEQALQNIGRLSNFKVSIASVFK